MTTKSFWKIKLGAVALVLGLSGVTASASLAGASESSHVSMSSHAVTVEHLYGTVAALPTVANPDLIEIQPTLGPVKTFQLSAATKIVNDKVAISVTSLFVGQTVTVSSLSSAPLNALVIKVVAPEEVKVDGTVTAITPNLTIQTNAGLSANFTLATTTLYALKGVAATSSVLAIGETVHVTSLAGVATLVNVVSSKPEHFVGVVTQLPTSGDANTMIIQPASGSPVSFTVSSSTVFWYTKAAVGLGQLMVGEKVNVAAHGSVALVVTITGPATLHLVGTVTASTPATDTAAATLTVQPLTGDAVTFTVATTTEVTQGAKAVSFSDLQPGDIVGVTSSLASPTDATIIHLRQFADIGRVTSVSGDVITLKSLGSQPLTVDVTSSTVFREKGKVVSLSSVLKGDIVVAVGPAVSGATALSATTVRIGTQDNPLYVIALRWYRHTH